MLSNYHLVVQLFRSNNLVADWFAEYDAAVTDGTSDCPAHGIATNPNGKTVIRNPIRQVYIFKLRRWVAEISPSSCLHPFEQRHLLFPLGVHVIRQEVCCRDTEDPCHLGNVRLGWTFLAGYPGMNCHLRNTKFLCQFLLSEMRGRHHLYNGRGNPCYFASFYESADEDFTCETVLVCKWCSDVEYEDDGHAILGAIKHI